MTDFKNPTYEMAEHNNPGHDAKQSGEVYIKMDDLSVGYNGKAIIRDICILLASFVKRVIRDAVENFSILEKAKS